MIYLACPYWHVYPPIRDARATVAAAWAASVFPRAIFSPLSHGREIERFFSIPPGNAAWVDFSLPFVRACDELHLLELPGWDVFAGVGRELELADETGKPIERISLPRVLAKMSRSGSAAAMGASILLMMEAGK